MHKQLFLILAFLIGSFIAQSQTVSTLFEGTPDDGITLDSNGNIYAAHYLGDTVFKFTPEGEMTPFITGLNTPNGLAFNSNEELYVCDGQGHAIYKYDIDGNLLTAYPITGNPSGIIKSFDDDSMIFTIHTHNSIHKLAPDGTITDISLAPEIDTPVGLAMDENGTLYVGNYSNRKIYKVLENGDVSYIAQLPTDGGALPNLGFITYGQGKIWGTTMGSDKIFHVNPNGIDDYTLFAGSVQGSADGDISVATFNTPNGIYYDSIDDKIYVTDFGTKDLRIISGVVLGNDDLSQKNTFLVMPNPVKEAFQIKSQNLLFEKIEVAIYDVIGGMIYKNKQHTFDKEINSSEWSQGVYLIHIKTPEGVFVKRILK